MTSLYQSAREGQIQGWKRPGGWLTLLWVGKHISPTVRPHSLNSQTAISNAFVKASIWHSVNNVAFAWLMYQLPVFWHRCSKSPWDGLCRNYFVNWFITSEINAIHLFHWIAARSFRQAVLWFHAFFVKTGHGEKQQKKRTGTSYLMRLFMLGYYKSL